MKRTRLISVSIVASMIVACSDNAGSPNEVESIGPVSSELEISPTDEGLEENSNTGEGIDEDLMSEVEASSEEQTSGAGGSLIDDMSLLNGRASNGVAMWFGDDDALNGGNSNILDVHGNSLARALMIQECAAASNSSGDEDGDGMSDCYPGWNVENGDAYDAGVLTADLELSSYVNQEGWGWAAAGFVLQFEGGVNDTIAQGYSLEDTLELVINYPFGKDLTVKAREADFINANINSPAKMILTGTGTENLYKIPLSEFVVPEWAENEFDPGQVYRISIAKEAAASQQGEALAESAQGVDRIQISCVGFNGACE
jgi:hypothetical protein